MNKPYYTVSSPLPPLTLVKEIQVPQACIPRLNYLLREVDTALVLPENSPER
jgi:hypothetical protein